MIHDSEIKRALENTLIFAGIRLLFEIGLGLCFALLLARRIRGISIFRLVFVLPLAVSGVASAVSWKVLFDTESGWVNYILRLMHLPQPNWLADPHTAMLSVVLCDAWTGVPIVTIIVLAGLLSLPREPIEAARVDGASEFGVFRHITLPGIAPVLGFAIIFRLTDLMRQFPLFFSSLTGGEYGLSTTVPELLCISSDLQFW